MGGTLNDRQATLGEVAGVHGISGLSDNQRRIVNLVGCGLCQSQIAKRLGWSRPYINQEIKKLESKKLIRRIDQTPKQGTRQYTYFYELTSQVKAICKPDNAEQYSACRVHNLRKKIIILTQSSPLSLDKRTGYQKSWEMRGWQGHKYWYPGKAGTPSVTLDINPKSIIAYVDKKQHIIAKNPQEAMEIGWRSIYAAVDQFIEQQRRFSVQVDVEHVGETLGKPHGGFVGSDSPVMEEGVTKKDWWIDRSQEAELGPGHPELETDKPENMTRLDNLIQVSEQVDLTTIPTAMKEINEKLNPLSSNVSQAVAMLQGGITISQQYEQMLNFMTKVLDEMAMMRKENAELKQRLGMT